MPQEVYQDLESIYKSNDQLYLVNWVFHFNPYSNTWVAIPRDKYNEYWDNYNHPDILRSSSINTLLELLHRSKGDRSLIEKLAGE